MMEYKINLKNEGQSWSLRFEHTVCQPNSMVFNKETRQWEDEKERVRISLIAEKKGKTPAFNQSISVASVSYIPSNKPEMIRMLTDEDASDIIDELINKEWKTHIECKADKEGKVAFRGFRGGYRLSWCDDKGLVQEQEFYLK